MYRTFYTITFYTIHGIKNKVHDVCFRAANEYETKLISMC